MSLMLYDSRRIKDYEVKYVKHNNAYFNINSIIPNDAYVLEVLERVEKVKRVSDITFTSLIHPDWGGSFSDKLSTGCKTFLNVYQHPDVCFSLLDCGSNFVTEILKLKSGKVDWSIVYRHGHVESCDVIYNDKRFFNTEDLYMEVKSLC